MRRKRTLPTPQHGEIMAAVNDGRQIHRLEDDPTLRALSPRSLAKNMAELEALRCRVQELEQQLAQHEIEALTPSITGKKLPPLTDPAILVVKSTCELRTVSNSVAIDSDRSATAPATSSRAAPLGPSVNPEKICAEKSMTMANSSSTPDLPNNVQATEDKLIHCGDRALALSKQMETKITIGQEGEEPIFAISQRNRLYQVLKRLSTLVTIPEDELVLLKKLVDAEIGDVISFLIEIEAESSIPLIREKLSFLVKNGSPSKHHNLVRPKFPSQHPVWGIQYPLQKIAQNLEQLRGGSSDAKEVVPSPNSSPSKKTDVIVLVSSGAYNPIHMLHIRAFYVARQYVESNYKFPVVGAFISPSHDTYVRVKNRRNTREMITKRHRLALIETAVASSSWIEVDKWEITRRRVMDYLSTLTHVREMCESHFPQYRFHVMYVCGCNTVVKLSHTALRDEGFGCVTVCRPAQTGMVMKHLGKTLSKTTTIVEDIGVLPCDLERATSFRIRQALPSVVANANMIEMMVGKPVFQYFVKHEIGAKIAGKLVWTEEDKQWRQEDLTYVEYTET